INELMKDAGKPRWDWQPEPVKEALNARVVALAEARLSDAYRINDKQERYAQVDVITSETIATLLAEDETLAANKPGEL
ncbi:polyribonucleotide nucleotidyltransferase, partial [Escherichia coli]